MINDLKHFKNTSPSRSYIAVLMNPCFYSVVLYRLSNKFYKMRLEIISKFIWLINRVIFNVDIDYRANIGKNFKIIHGLGIVIGCNVVIKDNVSIYQGVTIGGTGKEREYSGKIIDQPIIKEKCILYANSTIIGPIIIEEKSVIGAGTIVSKDIESNSLVYVKQNLVINKKNRRK